MLGSIRRFGLRKTRDQLCTTISSNLASLNCIRGGVVLVHMHELFLLPSFSSHLLPFFNPTTARRERSHFGSAVRAPRRRRRRRQRGESLNHFGFWRETTTTTSGVTSWACVELLLFSLSLSSIKTGGLRPSSSNILQARGKQQLFGAIVLRFS